LLPAFGKGDDVLLRAVLGEFEKAGFRIMGADEVMDDLLAQPGAWGAHAPSAKQRRDIELAARVAAAIGAFDVGQGVVACDGLVLALEAQEGTDTMLRRVAELPPAVRGTSDRRRGVLVKRPKPIQERRIDLPTIGVRTIEGAASAGLAGVAVEAGATLAVRRPDIIAAADKAGLYVYGFTRGEVGET
jgi:UDP-2,3-diacylglucosamine hydrolase